MKELFTTIKLDVASRSPEYLSSVFSNKRNRLVAESNQCASLRAGAGAAAGDGAASLFWGPLRFFFFFLAFNLMLTFYSVTATLG